MIFLSMKKYIYAFKMKESNLSFNRWKLEFKNLNQTEKYIALRNHEIENFNNSWGQLENIIHNTIS